MNTETLKFIFGLSTDDLFEHLRIRLAKLYPKNSVWFCGNDFVYAFNQDHPVCLSRVHRLFHRNFSQN